MDAILFFRRFLRNPNAVGAVLPTSARLARRLIEPIDWSAASVVVEYGPGTGAVTREVLPRLAGNTRFFAIERDPVLHERVTREFPGITVYNDSAANVRQCLERQGVAHACAIVSGLPWASFGDALQDEILRETVAALKPGGFFSTFAYIHGLALPTAQHFRRKLKDNFREVKSSPVVWANVPPGFVYWCWK